MARLSQSRSIENVGLLSRILEAIEEVRRMHCIAFMFRINIKGKHVKAVK